MTQQAINAEPVVFVVDDDIDVREGLKSVLGSVGLRCEVFASPRKFLQRKTADTESCLVLDVRTGHGDVPMSVKAMKAGAVEFLGLRGLPSVRAAFLAVFLLVLMVMPGVAVELDPDVVRVLEQLALPVPDPANPIVCHGFGCAYRTPILLRNADKAQIKKLFGPAAVKSAEEERKALAATMAWFEKRVAGEAGTATAKARAGLGHVGLLRHHVIDVPESRGFLVGGLPHTTAVVRERKGGQKWALDGWTKKNGELPDIMPMERWAKED